VAAEHDKPASEADLLPLRIAGSWLQALTDGSKEVVALLDDDGSVQYLSVSGAVQHILGYEALEIMGMQVNDLLHPLDRTRVLDSFRTVAAHPGGRISIEYRARHRAGHYVRLESTAVNRLRNDYVNAIVVHTREVQHHPPDVSAPRSSSAPTPRLEDEEGFVHAIDEAIEKARGGAYKFSVMVLELESRDSLLEAYGPEVSEGVLAEVGRRLHALLRPGDKLARIKTGPYAILLDGVGDRSLAERISARIQKTVGNRFSVKGQDVLSSATVGIATSERRYDRAEDVLRDAMLASVRAKGEGAERRAIFRTHMHVEKTRHMSLMAELHNALQRNQFRVHFMPTVSLATRTVSGFEALVRWYHPERGVISPDLFIPVAEETGLIVRLGRWVLLQACRQMVEWQKRYAMDPPLALSVNLSAKQFAEFDLDDQVEHILQDTEFDPQLLTLELAERAVLEHREAVVDAARRLRKLGVKLSLDNFGVGASSFTSLHQLAYDRLKIDRSLVGKMTEEGRGRELVAAIVGLAHNLSMEVVAEGVETPGQAAQLSKLWCEYAEGYLFGKPMDADAAGALIASYPRWWSG
jgi:PAS domain S-box-containing protein